MEPWIIAVVWFARLLIVVGMTGIGWALLGARRGGEAGGGAC
jgi:hypothetical protein